MDDNGTDLGLMESPVFNPVHWDVASLTVPGGQEFCFPHPQISIFFFLIFAQHFLIFVLILTLWVGELPTWEGSGYATASTLRFLGDF